VILYFDTNVFADLLEGTQADEKRLLEWRERGQHTIVLSIVNLEEAMAAELRDPELCRRLLRTILHWCSHEMFVKSIDLLLRDDITSYARGGKPVSPFLSGELLELARRGMEGLLFGRSADDVMDRLQTVLDGYAQNRSFSETIDAVIPDLREAAEEDKKGNVKHTIEKFFRESSGKFAAEFAKKCGVYNECAERGIAGLMELKSVRAAEAILISTIYSFALESREVCISDFRDLQHFTLASSSAEGFVTEDGSLVYRARRIPTDCVAIWSTQQLLSNCAN